MRLLGRLIANAVVGLILLFLTNLFLRDDLPVNLLTVLICAIGGVAGSDLAINSATHGWYLRGR